MLWLAGPAIDTMQTSWVLVTCAACLLLCQITSTESNPHLDHVYCSPSTRSHLLLQPVPIGVEETLSSSTGCKESHTLHLRPMPVYCKLHNLTRGSSCYHA